MKAQEKLNLRTSGKTLIYGVGNIGREDDGLGIQLIRKLEEVNLPSWISLEANYQLNIEDALLISEYEVVLFVDASLKDHTGYPGPSIEPVTPAKDVAFSTHAMSFDGVLALCESLYRKKPKTFLLELPGYQWGISEDLSERAQYRLDEAFRFICTELGVSVCTKSPS